MPSKKWQQEQMRWQSADELRAQQALLEPLSARGRGGGPYRGRGQGARGRGKVKGHGSRPFDLATYASMQTSSPHGYGMSSNGGRGGSSARPPPRAPHPNAHLRVKGQQAVPLDYTSLRSSARPRAPDLQRSGTQPSVHDVQQRTPLSTQSRNVPPRDDSPHSDDSDIVIEPPKGYVHTHKPHLERGYALENQLHNVAPRVTPDPAAAIPLSLEPNSKVRLAGGASALAPNTRQRQPASAHPGLGSRMSSTPAVGPALTSNARPYAPKTRAALSLLAQHVPASRPLRMPMRFVSAEGEWKDGEWSRLGSLATKDHAKETSDTRTQIEATTPDIDTSADIDDQHDAELVEELLRAYPQAIMQTGQNGSAVQDTVDTQRMMEGLELEDRTAELGAPSSVEDEGGAEEEILIPMSISQQLHQTSDRMVNQQAAVPKPPAGTEAMHRGMYARSSASESPDEVSEEESFVIDTQGTTGDPVPLKPGERVGIDRSALKPVASELRPKTRFVSNAAKDEYDLDDNASCSSADHINWTQRQPRGQGKKARNAAKKARRRERRAEEQQAKALGVEKKREEDWKVVGGDFNSSAEKKERIGGKVSRERRVGSDIEWGDEEMEGDDLADISGTEAEALRRAVQESLKSHEAEKKQGRESIAVVPQDKPRTEDFEALFSAGAKSGPGKKGARHGVDQEILNDYIANALISHDDNDDDDFLGVDASRDPIALAEQDHAALLSFVRSVEAQEGSGRVDPRDLAADEMLEMERAREAREEFEWETEGESEDSLDEVMEEAEEREIGETGLQAGRQFEDNGGDAHSSSEESESDSSDVILELESSSNSDSTESESESDHRGMFRGGRNVWANGKTKHEEDEDMIDRIEAFATANFDGLTGPDRKARKRLFKAIERGDFGAVEDLALPFEGTHDEYEARGKKMTRGPKVSASTALGEDDLWAEDLQEQWEKDRSKKADKKRARQEARLAAALSNTPGAFLPVKGGKVTGAKGRQMARAAIEATLIEISSPPRGGRRADDAWYTLPALTIHHLDKQMGRFVQDESRSILVGPNVGKKDEAVAKSLGKCWGLKMHKPSSQFKNITFIKGANHSKTSGKRDQILARFGRYQGWDDQLGKKTMMRPHELDDLLKPSQFEHSFGFLAAAATSSRSSYPSKFVASRVKKQTSAAAKRSGTAGALAPKNRDGTEVGFGADPIAQENVGHRLLTMMGWAAGSGLGSEAMQGRLEPVGATIKITKGGLGW